MAIFITIEELKTKLNINHLDVVENPKTSKLFAVGINSKSEEIILRIEQEIDFDLPVKYILEDAETALTEGCIINVKPTKPPVHRF